jgi:O-antigen/teichoic acid export membrane protein
MTDAGGLGVYSSAIAYYSLIALGGSLGATSYVVREIAQDHSRTNHLLTHLSVLGSLVAVLATVVLSLIVTHVGYSADLAIAICVILLATPAAVVKGLQRAVFIAHQKVGHVARVEMLGALCELSISLYLLTQGHSIVSLLVALVIQEYVWAAVYFFLIHRFIAPLSWHLRLVSALKLLVDIKSFAALSILGILFSRPEVILISLLCGEVEVGIYVAALKIVSLWEFVPQVLMTNVFPVLSRSYQESAEKFWFIQSKSIKYLLAVALPLAAGTVVVAGPMIRLLYGPGFDASVVILQILVWTAPLHALMAVLWRVLAAANQQRLDLRARVICLVGRLGGGYLLISAFASLGAAIIVPVSLLVNSLLLVHYVNRQGVRLQLPRLAGRCVLATAGMGLLASGLSDSLQLWALIPLAAAVYALLLVALKVFTPQDLMLFRKVWAPAVPERG